MSGHVKELLNNVTQLFRDFHLQDQPPTMFKNIWGSPFIWMENASRKVGVNSVHSFVESD